RRDRRADVDAVQLRIEARHHPHADVHALFVRHAAPGLVAGLPGLRDRARTPQLFAGLRVERGDDAGFGSALRLAAAARDDLAVHDDRSGAVLRARTVVEDQALPRELAGARVDRVCVAVRAVVEDQVAVDRDIAVRAGRGEVLADVVRDAPPILPDQVSGRGVDRLRD